MILSHNEIVSAFRRGVRNGNWRRLGKVDKSLMRAVIWYTRFKRRIVNRQLVAQVSGIVKILTTTIKTSIIEAGRARAQKMFLQYEEKGVFGWCPQLKKWMSDPKYVFWLGTL